MKYDAEGHPIIEPLPPLDVPRVKLTPEQTTPTVPRGGVLREEGNTWITWCGEIVVNVRNISETITCSHGCCVLNSRVKEDANE